MEQNRNPNARASSTRIFAILARNAPIGVILRRGPSKHVLLIKWDLKNDNLEYGQWFHGRIYERRCDLSPSGDLFLYFAAKYNEPLRSWTAISKPPYLTALAMWPKGDGWGGGGLFKSELSVQLNHRPGEDVLADGFHLKTRMRVSLYGEQPGWGEDFPIYHSLLLRHGWKCVSAGEEGEPDWRRKVVWEFTRPITYEKTSAGFRLTMLIKGVSQKNDAWYWIDYEVLSDGGELLFSLPRTDWADWDGNGDLLFARAGKLFRLKSSDFPGYQERGDEVLKQVADLSDLKFESVEAPAIATRW
ncbi:MAG TPA: hypothetical protein VEZ90_03250 [Blastocatellia bacterium]|nr:hypothetical protein [Blastocatellia bacterium]